MTKYLKLGFATIVFATAGAATAAEKPVFEKDVLPIFTRYCFNCHGKSSPQLGLDLRTARLTMRGSQNGAVVVAGSLEKSLLWQKLSKREMPPAQLRDTTMANETRQLLRVRVPAKSANAIPEDVEERRHLDETPHDEEREDER